MLALFDRNSKPPASLTNFKSLYSETSLLPLALLPTSEEEVSTIIFIVLVLHGNYLFNQLEGMAR